MFDNWEQLEETIKNCNRCKLYKTRNNIVFGEGKKNAKVMLIGEGPGQEEDRTGRLFVGKSGKLMDLAFQTLGIKREELYFANIIKCRVPANRNPEEEECRMCINYLRNQVILIKPKIIVLLRKCCFKAYIRRRIWNYHK